MGDSSVKFLVIVNDSPWGSGLSLGAWRFVRAALDQGIEVPAVFFRSEGVYNAVPSESHDPGTPNLAQSWAALAKTTEMRLLLCSSSRKRRMTAPPGGGFTESGLTEMLDLMLSSDRVVSF